MGVATEFVGPRPGCYIMKFCQGSTEIVFRIIVLVASVGMFIASAVSLGLVQDLPSFTDRNSRLFIENATGGLNTETLFFNSLAAGGIGVGIAILAIAMEILVIIIRFLNIGIVNVKSKIFLIIDIVISLIFAVVLNISGILAAYMANEWTKVLNIPGGEGRVVLARNSLIATAAFGLFDGLLAALLATWMLVFVLRNWNEKVIKETAKDII